MNCLVGRVLFKYCGLASTAGLALLLLSDAAYSCNRKVNVTHFGKQVTFATNDKEAGWLHFVKFRQIVQSHTGTDFNNDIETFVSIYEDEKNNDTVKIALNRLTQSAECGEQDAIDLMDELGGDDIYVLAGISQSQVQSAVDDYFYEAFRRHMTLAFGRQLVSLAMKRLGPRAQFATVSMRYQLTAPPECKVNESGDKATCTITASLDIKDEYNSSVGGFHGDLAGALRSFGNTQEFTGVINLGKSDGKWVVRGNPFGF